MSLTLNNLTEFHNAVVSGIKEKIPELGTVAAYSPIYEQSLNTPAVLIELTEMEPAETISGGRTAVTLSMAAHVFLAASDNLEDLQLGIRNLAVYVLQAVHRNHWGLTGAVGSPKLVEAVPGGFKPDCDGYESWIVTWEQVIYLGKEHQPLAWQPKEINLNFNYHIDRYDHC
ncbi:hypothetical protein KCM76_22730 [Zooshikella marina]|uniref:hypothetical protein n=1 Tax=Zooshikella ganghwensis TaxID=202772 RepID=UPI001BAE67AC|nr:hypothetical protein [Zooshikella ganghwensis]MBU2708827.1 hypothetical protein [Zooshikella ganghwensis]